MPKVRDGAIELNRLLESSLIAGASNGQAEDQAEKGAWEIAEVLGWKDKDGWSKTPREMKSGDETPNFIVVVVRKSGEFKPDSFYAENLEKGGHVRIVKGRLAEENVTAGQSIIFPRAKGWDTGKVLVWMAKRSGDS